MKQGVEKERGFTLIELLVVVVIIILLVGIVYTAAAWVRKSSHDRKRKAHINQIATALEIYRGLNKIYPAGPLYGISSCPNTVPLADAATTFIKRLPCDPMSPNYNDSGKYWYQPDITRTQFTLWTCLENPNDPDNSGAFGTCTNAYVVRD